MHLSGTNPRAPLVRLLLLILAIAAFAALAGCGNDDGDKVSNTGGNALAGGTGGTGAASNGIDSKGTSGDDASGAESSSSKSGANSSKSGSQGKSQSKNKAKSRAKGKAIVDDDSFDSTEEPKRSKAPLSSKTRSGLGTVLGLVLGASDEYLGEPLAAGRFRADSSKIKTSIADAKLVSPYAMRKLLLAVGAIRPGQAGSLSTDLTAAFATFEALKSLDKNTAGRRVARAIGTLNAALDTARKAGIKIDRQIPTRSDLKRER